jgi:hypothetical protein
LGRSEVEIGEDSQKSGGFALASRPHDPHNRSMRVRSGRIFDFWECFRDAPGPKRWPGVG